VAEEYLNMFYGLPENCREAYNILEHIIKVPMKTFKKPYRNSNDKTANQLLL
jgi:hypothetical protein